MNIATLIPAYKPNYLGDLLACLRFQTVRPKRVIVSDDSPGGQIRALLRSESMRSAVEGLPLEIVDGPRRGGFINIRNLISTWNGTTDLFHILMDDDVIYSEFYERHMDAHSNGGIYCSSSRRWLANATGMPEGEGAMPEEIKRSPSRLVSVGPEFAFSKTLPTCNNWFGEYSNIVMSAEIADLVYYPQSGDISFNGLTDLGACLLASHRAPVGFINDHLGFYRINPHQNTSQLLGSVMKTAHLAFFALAIIGRRLGHLTPENARACARHVGMMLLANYASEPDMAQFRALAPALAEGERAAEERFLEAWHPFTSACWEPPAPE